jgi:peptidoglycan/LPS O-acetylase OafA/YrhL
MQKIFALMDISEIKRISFRSDINGLRALAVLSVVFYHSDNAIFKGGWLGVDVFFVISGFLISNIIISELNESNFSFKRFYLRRIQRILPALYTTLIITIPLAFLLLTPKAMEEYVDSLISSALFYANYYFMNVDFYVAESTKTMPLIHMWSLAIEEQYYLIFPALAFLIYKFFKRYFTFIIGVLTILSLYLNTLTSSTDKFYKLEYRIWELFVGVLLMIFSQNIKIKHLEKIGIFLLIFPILYFDDYWINDLEPKIIALLGVSLIIFSNTKDTVLSKLLSLKAVSLIGLSSFSIYLLHQPFFSFFKVVEKNSLLFTAKYFGMPESLDILNYSIITFPNIQIVNLITILLTLLFGYLSFKNIELKLKKNKQLIFMLGFILIFSFYQLNQPNTYLFPSHKQVITSNETMFSDYNCVDKVVTLDAPFSNLGNCFIDNGSDDYLVILGDSSSAAIAKSIIKENLYKNFNYLFITLSYEKFFEDFNNFKSCNNCIIEWLKLNKENINIILSVELHRFVETEGIYYTDYSGENIQIFDTNIKLLSTIADKVIVIEPFPTMVQSKPGPKEYLNQQLYENQINEIYISLSDWKLNTIKSRQYLLNVEYRIPNLSILFTEGLFCDEQENKCLVYINENLFYVDQVHLSTQGGYIISKELEKYLD